MHIVDYEQMELTELLKELEKITVPMGKSIAEQALLPIKQLVNMGLGYLHLSRKMNTLSGGEAQRVKIARHIGSSLNNMTYIFDEPSAGLHPEEVGMLIQMMKSLKEQHNTVIVIEHDLSIIREADEMIEMGPEAGVHGGEVIYQGTLEGLENSGAVTQVNHKLHINKHPRKIDKYFTIKDANHNNLKNLNIRIPQNVLVSICGASGSGKSSLMLGEFTDKYPEAIVVGQGSIGISSRSTLATYMGIMDDIRAIFAKETGERAGLFSFNSLGACPVCNGKGEMSPDVAFAEPVTVTCEACAGTRYSDEALAFT